MTFDVPRAVKRAYRAYLKQEKEACIKYITVLHASLPDNHEAVLSCEMTLREVEIRLHNSEWMEDANSTKG